MLRSKIENAHWAEKLTTTRCGIREITTTRNFVSWLFLNNHNALWHVKICHEAKVMSWLLQEMTKTSLDFTKIPQDIFQLAEGSVSVSYPPLASNWATSCCFLQPCLLTVWRRFLMTKWRSWMMQAVIGAYFLITSVRLTPYHIIYFPSVDQYRITKSIWIWK